MSRKYVFKISFFLFFILLCVTCVSFAENENILRKSNYKKLVTQLGLTKANPLDQIKLIHKYAYLAAPLLVQELKLIKPYNMRAPELYKIDKNAMHVIWCIRALQSITGKRFSADTETNKKTAIQEYFGRKNPLPFFAEWMSRSEIYIAPQDVQKQIIKKWEIFLKNNPDFKIRKYDFWHDSSWYF